jgi:hypothetical protein
MLHQSFESLVAPRLVGGKRNTSGASSPASGRHVVDALVRTLLDAVRRGFFDDVLQMPITADEEVVELLYARGPAKHSAEPGRHRDGPPDVSLAHLNSRASGFLSPTLGRLRDAAAAFERLRQYGHIRRGLEPSTTGFLLVSARNLMFLGLAVSLLYGIVRDVKSGCSSLASSNTPTAYSLRAMLRRIRIGSGLQRVSGRASGRSR